MLWDHVEPSSIVLNPVIQSTSLPASSEPSAWSSSQLCNTAKQAKQTHHFFSPIWARLTDGGGTKCEQSYFSTILATPLTYLQVNHVQLNELDDLNLSSQCSEWQGKAMNDQIVSAHCRIHVWLYTHNSMYTEKAVRQPFLRPHCRHHIVNGDMPCGGILITLGRIGFFISIQYELGSTSLPTHAIFLEYLACNGGTVTTKKVKR